MSLFTGLSIKSYIIIGLFVALTGLTGLSYWYYGSSQNTIKILNENNATLKANQIQLKSSISEQNNLILNMESDYKESQSLIDDINNKSADLRIEVKSLENKLRKHDLEKLSKSKPRLIEKIINKGTKKVFREFEDISTY